MNIQGFYVYSSKKIGTQKFDSITDAVECYMSEADASAYRSIGIDFTLEESGKLPLALDIMNSNTLPIAECMDYTKLGYSEEIVKEFQNIIEKCKKVFQKPS